MLAPGQRKIARARRPAIPLTGAENVVLVDIGRILFYGIQYFLLKDNIRAIFGDRLAESKKLRKDKLKEVVKRCIKYLMNNNDIKKDDMTLDAFINMTRDLIISIKRKVEVENRPSASDDSIRKAIRELGRMESSPQEMEVMNIDNKRKKESPPAAAARAVANDAGPYRSPAEEAAAAAARNRDLEVDVLTLMLNKTIPSNLQLDRPDIARLNKSAKEYDNEQSFQRRQQIEAEKTENIRNKRALNKEVNNITDKFGKSKM